MRIVFVILFSVPITCFAIGLDSCRLEGKLNEKIVTLNWIYLQNEDAEGFGLKDSPIYGFCTMGCKSDGDYSICYMSCAASKDDKQVSYYETSKENGVSYVCKTGCNKNVVKRFNLICDGD